MVADAAQERCTEFTAPGGAVIDSVAFGQDGETLAIGSEDDAVRLWDVAYLPDPGQLLCASAGRSLTPAEWAQYAPGLPYQSICPVKTESAAS